MHTSEQSTPTYSAIIKDVANKKWLGFSKPVKILKTHSPDQVLPILRQVEKFAWQQGLLAVGFVCYEASTAFDSAMLINNPSPDIPLIWFGLYSESKELCCAPNFLSEDIIYDNNTTIHPVSEIYWKPSITRQKYFNSIKQIKKYIACGATYQINYTYQLKAACSSDPWQIFLKIAAAQQADYTTYLNIGSVIICSASPELFFSLDGNKIESRPMKGTARRGRFKAEDYATATWLRNSKKNQAENAMIVDMIRNDLGRIAYTGTVKVKQLFKVERYPTVWQMTSTVKAETSAGLPEIFSALFPCASITGAPKISTMRIIRDLEDEPRGLYTGAIGFVAPGRKAQFNVAIRTITLNPHKQQAKYGVGGGILWDSDAKAEYNESKDKARILTSDYRKLALLESLLWDPEKGYFLFDEHLTRMAESADYFNFNFPRDKIINLLNETTKTLIKVKHKIRLLLWQHELIRVETEILTEHNPGPVRLKIAEKPINSDNIFLFHKTTNRQVYNQAATGKNKCDDVILFNKNNEITETTIANLIIKVNDEYLTPATTCGLLAGVMRGHLLRQGRIKEGIISRRTLLTAKNIQVINSVRGQRPAILLTD